MTETQDCGDRIAEWATRPVARAGTPSAHAMSVDVEDYFQVEAFSEVVNRNDWDAHPSRIERNTDRILELFDSNGAKATFFTLGWIARRFPDLIRRVVDAGHELASHGMAHHRADSQPRDQFFDDVRESRLLLEDTGGAAVSGYRAASFSLSKRNLWMHDALVEAGYRYSSSSYPIRHDLYGLANQPRFAFHPIAGQNFLEIPVTTLRQFGTNWPCGGGGYFRLLPYPLFRYNMRRVIRRENQPCNFYFHPWEVDPDQPRISNARLKSRMRHYLNLDKTITRLTRLLNDFAWQRIDQVYPIGSERVQ